MNEALAILFATGSIIPAIQATKLLINSEADYQETSSLFAEMFPLGLFYTTWVACAAFIMRVGKHFIDVNDLPQSSHILWSFVATICGWVAFEATTKHYKNRTNFRALIMIFVGMMGAAISVFQLI